MPDNPITDRQLIDEKVLHPDSQSNQALADQDLLDPKTIYNENPNSASPLNITSKSSNLLSLVITNANMTSYP